MLLEEVKFDLVGFGLEENWALRVTPNPQVPYPAELYNSRIREKRWAELWPRLDIQWAKELDSTLRQPRSSATDERSS